MGLRTTRARLLFPALLLDSANCAVAHSTTAVTDLCYLLLDGLRADPAVLSLLQAATNDAVHTEDFCCRHGFPKQTLPESLVVAALNPTMPFHRYASRSVLKTHRSEPGLTLVELPKIPIKQPEPESQAPGHIQAFNSIVLDYGSPADRDLHGRPVIGRFSNNGLFPVGPTRSAHYWLSARMPWSSSRSNR